LNAAGPPGPTRLFFNTLELFPAFLNQRFSLTPAPQISDFWECKCKELINSAKQIGLALPTKKLFLGLFQIFTQQDD